MTSRLRELKHADRLFTELIESGDKRTSSNVLRALVRADAGNDEVQVYHELAVTAVEMATGTATREVKIDAVRSWHTAHAMLVSYVVELERSSPRV